MKLTLRLLECDSCYQPGSKSSNSWKRRSKGDRELGFPHCTRVAVRYPRHSSSTHACQTMWNSISINLSLANLDLVHRVLSSMRYVAIGCPALPMAQRMLILVEGRNNQPAQSHQYQISDRSQRLTLVFLSPRFPQSILEALCPTRVCKNGIHN